MDDHRLTFFADKAPYTVTPLKASSGGTKHRCHYGSTGRCPCGFHRTPERAVGIAPLATSREHLAIEL